MDAEEFELRDGSPTALSAAQDEIERRISECETHRALVDAVLVERDAEAAWEALPIVLTWNEEQLAVFARLNAARSHRRAVADSIGGA